MLPFEIHNLFRKSRDEFLTNDPNLSALRDQPYVFQSPLEDEIPLLTPGIYILTGGRQIGKSTLLKQLLAKLLRDGIDPNLMWYLPCDTITRFEDLLFSIDQFRNDLPKEKGFFLFIDEITYVKEWDRALKSLADEGFFRRGSVLITGSDSIVLKEAMMRFPGRRGNAAKQDFHYAPLSFSEHVALLDKGLFAEFAAIRESFGNDFSIKATSLSDKMLARLSGHFESYLLSGGFLKATNDLAKGGSILPATYATYVQWIIGDMLKRGKNERSLREIVEALIPRLAKQMSWHKITEAVSIESHVTVSGYIDLFERMNILRVLYALKEDKLTAAPKKDRKIHFHDPFILHALHAWVKGEREAFSLATQKLKTDIHFTSAIVEGVIASLIGRNWNSFYIKAKGEVDVAIVKGKRFLPLEIKYSSNLRRNDLQQILKYKHGLIAYAGNEIGRFDHLQVIPIPLMAFIAA